MKDEKVTEKKSGGMSEFWRKASDAGKKVADGVSKGTKSLAEKAKEYNHEQKLKKLNPLTMKEYKSKSFHIPNVIRIVDDAERRDNELCVGAIGWRETVKDVEILCIYDEYMNDIGVQFIPAAKCNSIYCVDQFDRKRFLESDCIFSKATEERLAELEHIAYSLGAKICSIEIVDANVESTSSKQQMNLDALGVKTAESKISASKNGIQSSGKTTTYFKGSEEPKKPTLKWFAHDDNIKGLIEMRCTDKNAVKSKILEIKGSTSATMSQKVACAIDAKIKGNKIKGGLSMESQAIKEQSSKLIFEIEF